MLREESLFHQTLEDRTTLHSCLSSKIPELTWSAQRSSTTQTENSSLVSSRISILTLLSATVALFTVGPQVTSTDFVTTRVQLYQSLRLQPVRYSEVSLQLDGELLIPMSMIKLHMYSQLIRSRSSLLARITVMLSMITLATVLLSVVVMISTLLAHLKALPQVTPISVTLTVFQLGTNTEKLTLRLTWLALTTSKSLKWKLTSSAAFEELKESFQLKLILH